MDLRHALAYLGWSQAKFAKKLGVRQNTVSDWRVNGLPQYAEIYLQAAVKAKETWDWFDSKP